VVLPGPSPGFSNGGAKNQKGGPHFLNTVLDVCSNRGTKREMGGNRFQMGCQAPLAPPLATALGTSWLKLLRFVKNFAVFDWGTSEVLLRQ